MKILTLSLLLSLGLNFIARADVPPPPPASQTDVNTGAAANKFVSPKTLAGWAGPGGHGVATTNSVNAVAGTVSFTTINVHAQSGHGLPAVEYINNNLTTFNFPSNNVDNMAPLYGEIPATVAQVGTNAISRISILSTNGVAFTAFFYSFLNQALFFTNAPFRWSTTASDAFNMPYQVTINPGMNVFYVTNTYNMGTNSSPIATPVMAYRFWRAADSGGATNAFNFFWRDTTVYFTP